MKEIIEKAYEEHEYTRPITPYKIYLEAIEQVFDLTITNSFADLGCSNGRLMQCINNKYPGISLLGLEYFEWAKKYAHPAIADRIKICDLGKPYTFNTQYDIVNCSEVGEHLEPNVESTFIDNVTNAAKDILILTWSNAKSDTNDQHVNPKPQHYVITKLAARNFSYWPEATDNIKNYLRINLEAVGNTWWPDNIMVFKRNKFINTKSRYFIQGIHTDNDSHKIELAKGAFRVYGSTDLQTEFTELGKQIRLAVASNQSLSILRASDGDYFFLKKIPIGSAKPGKRALTTAYENINMFLFKSLFWHNNIIALNLGQRSVSAWRSFIMTELFVKILNKFYPKLSKMVVDKKIRYGLDLLSRWLTLGNILPTLSVWLYALKRGKLYKTRALTLASGHAPSCEAVYALTTTTWLFKNFRNQIGIIANEAKVELIQELMKKDEYRKHLGIDSFTDYIGVPQKGAADEVEKLAQSLSEQISKSTAKIFMVGAGSSKMALIPLLKRYSNAVFIDAGASIDAIAGIVCQERPYFADWKNFRLKDFDYSKIDFMDQGNPAWERTSYKTETI